MILACCIQLPLSVCAVSKRISFLFGRYDNLQVSKFDSISIHLLLCVEAIDARNNAEHRSQYEW